MCLKKQAPLSVTVPLHLRDVPNVTTRLILVSLISYNIVNKTDWV